MSEITDKRKPKDWMRRFFDAKVRCTDIYHDWLMRDIGFVRYCADRAWAMDLEDLPDKKLHEFGQHLIMATEPDLEKALAEVVLQEIIGRAAGHQEMIQRMKAKLYPPTWPAQLQNTFHHEMKVPAIRASKNDLKRCDGGIEDELLTRYERKPAGKQRWRRR